MIHNHVVSYEREPAKSDVTETKRFRYISIYLCSPTHFSFKLFYNISCFMRDLNVNTWYLHAHYFFNCCMSWKEENIWFLRVEKMLKRSTQNVNRLRTPLIWVIVIVVVLQKLSLKQNPYKLINLTLNIIFSRCVCPRGFILKQHILWYFIMISGVSVVHVYIVCLRCMSKRIFKILRKTIFTKHINLILIFYLRQPQHCATLY